MKNLLLTKISFFVAITLFQLQESIGQILDWSPSSTLSVRFSSDATQFSLYNMEKEIMAPIFPALVFGKDTIKLAKGQWKETLIDETYSTPFYRKSKVRNYCKSFSRDVSKEWTFEIRIFEDGVAYRWAYKGKEVKKLGHEICHFPLKDSTNLVVGYGNGQNPKDPFFQSFESVYNSGKPHQIDSSKLIYNPMMIRPETGGFLVLTEAGLSHYPGLHWKLKKGKAFQMESQFARVPAKSVREGTYAYRPVERAPHVAGLSPGQVLPWRVFGYFENEGKILTSDLVYNLSEPQKVQDVSWITPGKGTWDWWNNWSISGVPFKAGSNTATYKYYIDFAAEKGLEYFNIDDGWSDMDDLYKIKPDVNLDEVLAYAAQKKVKILLWATWFGIAKDKAGILQHYAKKGVAGFKIDFLDRDDQEIITWMEDVLIEAAKNKLLINFHGACKPTGWARTYPNEVNREGVHGAESFKWSNRNTTAYECMIPFIRGFAGVLDYTPGGLRNIDEKNFKPVFSMPMVKGTRCHQLALYGIFEAPLQMVSDLPQTYRQEPEAIDFISAVPTVWEETRVLAAEFGKVIALARKSKTGKWYVFVLGNDEKRILALDLSFTAGKSLKGLADGINAERNSNDWKSVELPLKTEITLAPGGGFVGTVEKL